jgi:hypothetical protein
MTVTNAAVERKQATRRGFEFVVVEVRSQFLAGKIN